MAIFDEKYKLPPDIVIKRKKEKYLFLSPLIPSWLVTNLNGATALKLCNGKRTLEEINRIISKSAARDTTDELKSFFHKIVLKSSLFLASEEKTSIYYPCNLRVIHLNLTNKCNLKCIYCYAEERVNSRNLLQVGDFFNIIDSINNMSKNAVVVLTGGEPLLSGHVFDVAEYARNNGNQVHILTNGMFIDKSNAKQITEVSDLIQISLDGSTPDINDFHRGKGSYNKIIKAINVLLRHNAPLQISMTVTARNINDIEAMVNKFGSLLSFAPLFKAGRAKTNKDLTITGKEYYKALFAAKGANPLSYLCSSLDKAKKQKIMKCAIGDAEISISDNGDVYPCHLLHIPQFLAGNVKEQSLESIYQTSDKLKECTKLTVLEIKGCNKCDVRFICGGACRARAFFEKGKIDVCDDFCEYEKLAFINGLFELHQFD